MPDYQLRILSSAVHTPDVLYHVLSTSTLAQWLFPCKLPLETPQTYQTFDSAHDFELPVRPSEDGVYHFPLHAENEIKFTTTIYTRQPLVVPNVIGIEFPAHFIADKVVNPASIRQTLTEFAPVFRIDQATLYDRDISQYRKRTPYYFGTHNLRYPMELGWMSYFGGDLLAYLGEERFTALETYASEPAAGGIFLVLHDTPFNAVDDTDRAYEAQAVTELGLATLSKRSTPSH